MRISDPNDEPNLRGCLHIWIGIAVAVLIGILVAVLRPPREPDTSGRVMEEIRRTMEAGTASTGDEKDSAATKPGKTTEAQPVAD